MKTLALSMLSMLALLTQPGFAYELNKASDGDRSSSKDLEGKWRSKVSPEDAKPPLMVDNRLADYSVVQIMSSAASPGSGVIITNKNGEYFVVTAGHVIGSLQRGEDIDVRTLDGRIHRAALIEKLKGVDAALVSFTSKNKYYPAFVDPLTRAMPGQQSFVIGFALPSREAQLPTLRKALGSVLAVSEENQRGYTIIHSSATNAGMSGGPVFAKHKEGMLIGRTENWGPDVLKAGDCKADYFFIPPLIGIHGMGESYVSGGKSGANLAMSIHLLLGKFASVLLQYGITKVPEEADTLIYKEACPIYNRNNAFQS